MLVITIADIIGIVAIVIYAVCSLGEWICEQIDKRKQRKKED